MSFDPDLRDLYQNVILDHHKTAAEDLKDYRAPFGAGWERHLDNAYQDRCEGCSQVYALFDMERSGAALAWDGTAAGTHIPHSARRADVEHRQRDSANFGGREQTSLGLRLQKLLIGIAK